MTLAICKGIVTESTDMDAPLNEPCSIMYDIETGLIKSAHRVDGRGGTHFSEIHAKTTKWKRI